LARVRNRPGLLATAVAPALLPAVSDPVVDDIAADIGDAVALPIDRPSTQAAEKALAVARTSAVAASREEFTPTAIDPISIANRQNTASSSLLRLACGGTTHPFLREPHAKPHRQAGSGSARDFSARTPVRLG